MFNLYPVNSKLIIPQIDWTWQFISAKMYISTDMENDMKLVILDASNANPGDLSWDIMKQYGDVTIYEHTPDDVYGCIKDADAVFTDNTPLSGDLLQACSNLKFIGKLATGYDNIDLEAASRLGIAVYNTPGYSTDAVAQHTIALLLEAACRIRAKNTLAKQGLWVADGVFSYDDAPSMLLAGKSLGIIGYGNIGRKVGEIASALGMSINVYSRSREAAVTSDVITLHCPATADNYHMIDEKFISQMKDGAIIINTARGSLIDEAALAGALKSGKISYAALDVLEQEPPGSDTLLALENCCITPHAAWIPPETRQKVIDIAAQNISDYINGKDTNRII